MRNGEGIDNGKKKKTKKKKRNSDSNNRPNKQKKKTFYILQTNVLKTIKKLTTFSDVI